MSVSTVLFDLDGTLLPMDMEVFIKHYFGLLAKKLAPYGYESKALINAIWEGTGAMVRNNGTKTNEKAFWDRFCQLMGEHTRKDEPIFDDYYRNEFQAVQTVCGFAPEAAGIVRNLKERGFTVALATNPIFPAVATHSRIRWAGLRPEDFALITTYENAGYCKPNPDYYLDICKQLRVSPGNCMMVGNDVTEDMVAGSLGMQTFLLTDCLINRAGTDIDQYPHGSFRELQTILATL